MSSLFSIFRLFTMKKKLEMVYIENVKKETSKMAV